MQVKRSEPKVSEAESDKCDTDQLVASCASRAYWLAKKIFDLNTTLIGARVVDGKRRSLEKEDGQLDFMLKAYIPFSWSLSGCNADWQIGTWLSRLAFILFGYMTIKMTALATVQLEYDRRLGKLRPTVAANASRTANCALTETIFYDENKANLATYRAFVRTRNWMEFMGSPIATLQGTAVVQNVGLATLIAVYTLLGYVRLDGIRIDYLNAMFSPLEERRRFQAEVRNMIRTLLRSSKNYADSLFSRQNPSDGTPAKGRPVDSLRSCRERQDIMATMRVLLDPKLPDLVRPAHLSAHLHQARLRLHLKTFLCMNLINLIASLFIMGLMIAKAVLLRTRARLDSIECTRWKPNGALIRQDIHLLPLHSPQDEASYETFDGSVRSLYYLAYTVEFKYFLTTNVMITITETFVTCLGIGICITFYTSLYMGSYIDQLVWLDQLELQLEQSFTILFQKESAGVHKNDQLIKSFTAAYLNFELFRRHQKHYLRLTNFVFSQMSWTTIVIFVCCLAVSFFNGKLDPITVLFLVSYLSAHMNTYMLSAAYRTHRLKLLMKKLVRILAHSAGLSLNLSQSVDMWRRQLLSFDELQRLLAPRVLGIHMSYENALTFNVYYMALWVLVARSSG